MMKSSNYEFDHSQNALINQLANRMKFVSFWLIIGGIIAALSGLSDFPKTIGATITGISDIFIGIWTNQAASSFQLIVNTEGKDIENLMIALGELRKLYNLQYWVLIISIVFLVVALAIGFLSALF